MLPEEDVTLSLTRPYGCEKRFLKCSEERNQESSCFVEHVGTTYLFDVQLLFLPITNMYTFVPLLPHPCSFVVSLPSSLSRRHGDAPANRPRDMSSCTFVHEKIVGEKTPVHGGGDDLGRGR